MKITTEQRNGVENHVSYVCFVRILERILGMYVPEDLDAQRGDGGQLAQDVADRHQRAVGDLVEAKGLPVLDNYGTCEKAQRNFSKHFPRIVF